MRVFANRVEPIQASGERPAGSVILCIPVPPPANNLYVSVGKRRIKSKRFKAWHEEAAWRVKIRQPPAETFSGFTGKVRVDLTVKRQGNRKTDIDGRIKAPLDLLVYLGVIQDDRQVEEITARWSDEVDEAVIVVEAVHV